MQDQLRKAGVYQEADCADELHAREWISSLYEARTKDANGPAMGIKAGTKLLRCADMYTRRVDRHVHRRAHRHAVGEGCVPPTASRRGSHFEPRHIYARAVGVPSAMADMEPI